MVARGNNSRGVCNVSAPNAGFVALTAGTNHSFGQNASDGDVNCDDVVDFADIKPLVFALGAAPLRWNLAHPGCHWLNADCNSDGYVDFADFNPFVSLLVGS